MPAPALASAAAYYALRTRTGRRIVITSVALGMVMVLMLVVALMAVLSSSGGGVSPGTAGCVAGMAAPPPPGEPAADGQQWDDEQRANAAVIAATGQEMGAPPRAQWIALATAMQESTLRNLSGGDRDSLGLFQQRPSMGWGSPAEIQDPAYAARMFYERLLELPGWAEMALTAAAQAVQASAFPDAYARWEQAAADLLATLGGDAAAGLACPPVAAAPAPGGGGSAEAGAGGHAVEFAHAQLGKPYVWGATGPDEYDCSGLTMQAWKAAGVQIPRVSRDQTKAGQQVPREQTQPGDLVFWSSNGAESGVHHVALSLGGNQIVEAPESGTPVRIRELGGSYDEQRLLPYAVRPGPAAEPRA
ncbi:C40 family peptidase [Pseudonocardia sp. ICBG1142]|uniref:C40 family peptidase n=1 Tax=Pseudonocardia sp. ICBG1142 TaxID=2846760 RepID=UPI001CF60CEA|nr:C40 family peptidase [Pseudonocardia sp. ICBG1142]